MKSSPKFLPILAASIPALLSTSCGGGGGQAASQGPGTQTVTYPGGLSASIVGTVNPPVTAIGTTAIVTGVAGGTISALTQSLTPDDLENTQILFERGSKLMGMAPDGTGLMTYPVTVSNQRAAFSPAGNVLAYTPNIGSQAVQIMFPNGTGQTSRIATSGQFFPAWSPDGKSLTFASTVSAKRRIYTSTASGTGLKAVSDNGFFDSNPTWSASFRRIYFSRLDSGNQTLEWVPDTGGIATNISNGRIHDDAPCVSPLENEIVFENGGALSICDMDGGNTSTLATPPSGAYHHPSWSPDGSKVVFEYQRAGFPYSSTWIINADGTNAHQVLGAAQVSDVYPTWSPFFRHRTVVGANGFLGTSASGFLLGIVGHKVGSVFTFDCPAANRNSAKLVNETPVAGGASLVMSVTADSITSMGFVNGISQVKIPVVPATGQTTATGALVEFDGATSEILNVLPYSASKAVGAGKPSIEVQGSTRVFRGHFLGVFDRTGTNIAPAGAATVRVELHSGKLLSIQ